MIDESDVEPWEHAASRVSFQLTYAASNEKREFGAYQLTGPQIECAYHHKGAEAHTSPGEWEYGARLDEQLDEEECMRFFFITAIREASHEAMEWFQVDGKPLLDPHDARFDDTVHELTQEFGEKLWELYKAKSA